MKVVELFAGVGGFRLGLERAGHQVIWANEWDKYAADTYDKNFGGTIDRRSIVDVPATDIPAHDLICGGFPCQAFSIAGRRRGFEETRGTLFFEIMRIARHHRTPYLLLENVKGLLSHAGGRTFTTILTTMDELGYDCQWQVLNSRNFGVPQNRERIIIVGHLRGRSRPQVFPIGQDGGLPAPARGEAGPQAQVSNALRAHGTGGGGDVEDSYVAVALRGREGSAQLEARADGVANTVRTPTGGGSMGVIMQRPRGRNAGGTHKIAPTLTGTSYQDNNHVLATRQLRRLTPVECERLQSFPDGWTAGVSDTQRYKQMGNAVTVNVIEAVARKL